MASYKMFDPPHELHHGDLRVWWVTDKTTRHYYVKDIEQAATVIAVLTKREVDDETITMNAAGLEAYDNKYDEWTEWYDSTGSNIHKLMDREETA